MNGACIASFATELADLLGVNLPLSTRIQYLLIGAAGFLIIGAMLISALSFLRSRRRKRSPHRPRDGSGEASSSGRPRESGSGRGAGRRRRRRREYPRRPTLAESGGLPPLRQPPSGPKDFPNY